MRVGPSVLGVDRGSGSGLYMAVYQPAVHLYPCLYLSPQEKEIVAIKTREMNTHTGK